ncbi:MAG: YkgJ family cysteine cluster protein [Lachnospiraceae bacterium]
MLREVSMEEISDGKRYTANDMAKIGCNGCVGCSECCRGMSDSIVLDPYDVYRLTAFLNQSFESLIGNGIALQVVDGLVLPVIDMNNDRQQCVFLNEQGRCSVHSVRPGICRLFPLGRIYEEEGFSYFLQTDQCPAKNKTKVKIKKWIEEPDVAAYEQMILSWHQFLVAKRCEVQGLTEAEEIKALSMKILSEFYVKGFGKGAFAKQLTERIERF